MLNLLATLWQALVRLARAIVEAVFLAVALGLGWRSYGWGPRRA